MKKVFFYLYPLGVFIFVPILILYKHSHAGTIRRMEISQDRPGIVRLAFGRSTAISFLTRPEKVVPGSPASIEVNFLQKDLTVRPLTSKPGNLIVYTKSGRYVILFQLVSENAYDDVVSVIPSNHQKGINLFEQSLRLDKVSLLRGESKSEQKVFISTNNKIIEFDQDKNIFQKLYCEGCTVNSDSEKIKISCKTEINSLNCNDKQGRFTLKRGLL